MVRRDDFDHAWYRGRRRRRRDGPAELPGPRHRPGRRRGHGDAGGRFRDRAGVVIGADGSAGISSRHVGVTFEQQDLGLEVELAATEADRAAWRGRVQLDWGAVPGSYGWVFPKDDELTVGVIMAKGKGAETKEYLSRFLAQLGLTDREVRRDSGHLTRCRTADAPLRARPGARRGRRGGAARAVDPGGHQLRPALRLVGRRGRRAGGPAPSTNTPRPWPQHLIPEMAAGRRLLRASSPSTRIWCTPRWRRRWAGAPSSRSAGANSRWPTWSAGPRSALLVNLLAGGPSGRARADRQAVVQRRAGAGGTVEVAQQADLAAVVHGLAVEVQGQGGHRLVGEERAARAERLGETPASSRLSRPSRQRW